MFLGTVHFQIQTVKRNKKMIVSAVFIIIYNNKKVLKKFLKRKKKNKFLLNFHELYLDAIAGTKLKSRQLQAIASKSEIFGISDVVEKKKKKIAGRT